MTGQQSELVVAGYYGFGNLGDEAIRVALREALAKRGIDTLWLTARPQTKDEIDRRSLLQLFTALRRSRALVLGGGGLLQNRTSGRSLLYYLGLIGLARMARRPVFLLGQGIGPIDGRVARLLTRVALKGTSYIGCRDRGSVSFLRTLGLNAVIDGDLFFLLPPVEAPPIRSSLVRHIILCLKGAKDDAEMIEKIVHMLDEVSRETKISVTLLPFFPAQDLALSEKIASRLNIPCRIVHADSIDNTMHVLERADLVISSRLHGLEFALRAGAPMIAITEDQKIDAFVAEVRETSGLQIPCVRFASSEQVMLVLESSPAFAIVNEAYLALHARATEGFSRFVAALEEV